HNSHRVIGSAVGQPPAVIDRNDTWMLKACEALCFFQRIRRVCRPEISVDYFDRDVPVQASVAGRVDYSHTSAPKLFAQLVWRAGQVGQLRYPLKMIQRTV